MSSSERRAGGGTARSTAAPAAAAAAPAAAPAAARPAAATAAGRRRLLGALAALPAAGLAAACGFEPLHAPGKPAAGIDGRVAVDRIDGEAGFALRERLVARLGADPVAADPPAASHRLAVDLVILHEGAAVTQDNITTRYAVTGTAAFRLHAPGSAEPVLAETVEARTGYSTSAGDAASAFAARAAARDAELRLARELADRIAMRLAVTAADWAAGTPAGSPAGVAAPGRA